MKWLLITNNGNPGDIWVRLGVQAIIRRLDEKPTWIIRERDHRHTDPNRGLTEPTKPLKFDYSVICGMPMVWSHREPDGTLSSPTQHESWQALTGWLNPEKMIIAGFGMYLMCPDGLDKFEPVDRDVVSDLQKLFDRCLLVYARSPLAKKVFHHVFSLHCPSVLSMKPAENRDLKLANFMPGGGHYPHLSPEAAKIMEIKMPELAKRLIDAGFHFAAHRRAERDLALELGWPRDRIHLWMYDGTGENMLDVYSRCSKYFGNRIHGGIMSRAAGAEVCVVGYDTRLAAVQYMGGLVHTPLDLPEDYINAWIDSPPVANPYPASIAERAHVTWWSTNLRLNIKG